MRSSTVVRLAAAALFVAAGFAVAAIVAGRNAFIGFGVLVGTGFVVGAVRTTSWLAVPLGSALGGAGVAAGYAVVTARTAELTSGALVGLLFGVSFVLPGFLFGRALRRSELSVATQPESTGEGQPISDGPSATAYVASGCLILVIVGALIALFVSSLANMGY